MTRRDRDHRTPPFRLTDEQLAICHEPSDWFPLVFGIILGLVVGGMLGISFASLLVPA